MYYTQQWPQRTEITQSDIAIQTTDFMTAVITTPDIRVTIISLSVQQEEVAQVNENVEGFNRKIDDLVWSNKQEEFEQGLKFIKDKDNEWDK